MNGARQAAVPQTSGTVSSTSAQRFAERVRRRRRRRLAIGAGLVVLALGFCWLAVLSPWATVGRIEIIRIPATAAAGDRIPDAQLSAQARSELGHAMLLARVDDVRDRLERLRLVQSASVSRSWPSTLVLTVHEREPVAAVPAAGAGAGGRGLVLVDTDGVQLGRVNRVPRGLPRLDVNLESAGAASLQACLAMLQRLPPRVADQVRSIGADSPDGITLRLDDGAQVQWGDASATARKAEVLLALLPQKAVSYDVRSPETPAIRKG